MNVQLAEVVALHSVMSADDSLHWAVAGLRRTFGAFMRPATFVGPVVSQLEAIELPTNPRAFVRCAA